ncbi:MAG: hypothetical protein P1V97_04155 [Planctomycetota bacterium]|nr:hypothetical protein [Planctomycetota bacterium]
MSDADIRTILTEALEFLDQVFGYSEMDDPDFASKINSLHSSLTRLLDKLKAGTSPDIGELRVYFNKNGVLPRLASELQCEGRLDDCVAIFQSLP